MNSVKQLLNELRVRPSKDFGQNFLLDPGAVEKIVRFAAPEKDGQLLEIGGGLGALTEPLSKFGNLTVIEIDRELSAYLQQRYPNIRVIKGDVRFIDFSEIGSELTVFGNLPYAFSTDIVFQLIKQRKSVKRAILMLQKEFAERMAAAPGSRVYGALSITTQLWAEMRLGPVFPGSIFYPATEVDSKVIELRMRTTPLVDKVNEQHFQKVVQFAFRARRKKILNSLKISGLFAEQQLKSAFELAAIDPNLRPEQLSVNDFGRLTFELYRSRDLA